jgi:hypothetical protein
MPWNPRKSEFPNNITEISPNFVDIYNQAIAAETHQLNQLVGIGLRKALEFLVKDFARTENSEKENEIICTPLGKCAYSGDSGH